MDERSKETLETVQPQSDHELLLAEIQHDYRSAGEDLSRELRLLRERIIELGETIDRRFMELITQAEEMNAFLRRRLENDQIT